VIHLVSGVGSSEKLADASGSSEQAANFSLSLRPLSGRTAQRQRSEASA